MSAELEPLAQYSRAAHRSSARIITEYSSSFGLASRLFARPTRDRVADIYALVRIADEIVDGAAEQAGVDNAGQRDILDELETQTHQAIAVGYSSNLVVHSFARTAREAGIGTELTAPFFASMRRDLSPVDFNEAELREYVYGSAEVIGLMCLRVFLIDHTVAQSSRARLDEGARRLGSAFQRINFLRDLADDFSARGRRYFPGIDPERLTEAEKDALVAQIQADLAAARETIPLLPPDCRRAVVAAHELFSALTVRLRETPAPQLVRQRVRVPTARKLGILMRSMAGAQ
ncbi:phytoene/squalene synthase family protein [Diaminobutyricimonas sp. TR449]|uniref:phytoene/squalene synthase family protein n=1 Tax=Diaminobutyricimonas sp. TR449 TaxID=2708076 RepID=UPI0014239AA0|nr:phytoene/squalene synthase family protein [Diaminobutyricimonas sp. TR449]